MYLPRSQLARNMAKVKTIENENSDLGVWIENQFWYTFVRTKNKNKSNGGGGKFLLNFERERIYVTVMKRPGWPVCIYKEFLYIVVFPGQLEWEPKTFKVGSAIDGGSARPAIASAASTVRRL